MAAAASGNEETVIKVSASRKRARNESDSDIDRLDSSPRSKHRPDIPSLSREEKVLVNNDTNDTKVEGHAVGYDSIVEYFSIDVDHKKKVDEVVSTCNEHEKLLIGGIRFPEDLCTTFKDIHLPAATIESLRILTTLSILRPDAFSYGVLAKNKILGVLLYGPPGTGKTHLAKAVAKESGATMLEVSGADVLQQYIGEGEKVVRAIFTLAQKLDPCIIFFDEADGVFRARSDDEKGYHRELLNQFLREWDGITKSKAKDVFMMVSTNRPFDLDEAVLRRLPRRILIDIPNTEDREEILKIYLGDETLGPDMNISKLAASTTNYTGSDIKNLCVAAAFACVYEEIKSVHDDGQLGRVSLKLSLAKANFPVRRTLHARHFDKAREDVSAAVDKSVIKRIRDFHDKRRMPQRGNIQPLTTARRLYGSAG